MEGAEIPTMEHFVSKDHISELLQKVQIASDRKEALLPKQQYMELIVTVTFVKQF